MRVLIADKHVFVRNALKLLLTYQLAMDVIDEVATTNDVLDHIILLSPNLVVLSRDMDDGGFDNLVKKIIQLPNAPMCIVLCNQPDLTPINTQEKPVFYLSKWTPPNEIESIFNSLIFMISMGGDKH